MSLNCLRRKGSEEEMRLDGLKRIDEDNNKHNFKVWLDRVEKTWSGNLSPNFKSKPDYDRMRTQSHLRPGSKPKRASIPRHRVHNSGPISFEPNPTTPRLVRSCGMRRDWSFEDLRRTMSDEIAIH